MDKSKLKSSITECLTDHGLNPTEGGSDELEWAITGNIRNFPFGILKPIEKNFLVLQRNADLGDDFLKILKSAGEKTKRKFINELKRDLLLQSPRYAMTFEDKEETLLTSINFTDFIYLDNYSQDLLIQRIFNLHSTTLTLLIHVRRVEYGDY